VTDRLSDLHERAMALAESAFEARRLGQLAAASEAFHKALDLEKQAAELLPANLENEPSRSILFRSAATLALHAALPDEAVKLAAAGLLGSPPLGLKMELGEVLERGLVRSQPALTSQPRRDP